jgi:hypothetical protein
MFAIDCWFDHYSNQGDKVLMSTYECLALMILFAMLVIGIIDIFCSLIKR